MSKVDMFLAPWMVPAKGPSKGKVRSVVMWVK